MSSQPNSADTPQDAPAKQEALAGQEAPATGRHAAAETSESPLRKEALIRKKKRKHSKLKKRLIIAGIIMAVVAVIAVGAALAINHMIQSGKSSFLDPMHNASLETSDNAASYDEGKTVTYNGTVYQLNENMVSVLLIGFDRKSFAEAGEASGQSDAMMVLAMDTQTGKTTAIAIPRDSMIDVDMYTDDGAYTGQQRMQACLAYSFGDGGTTSSEMTSKAISRLLYNMPLNYYFSMDMNGIGPLSDAIGGVALTPLQSIPGTGIVEGEPTVLFGNNALRYVQYRDITVMHSSLDRQARQTQFVSTFFSQALSQAKGNVGTLVSLFNTVSQYSVTNMDLDQYSFLASCLVNNGVSDIQMVTLPGEITQSSTYAEFNVDMEGTYQIILDTYYTPIGQASDSSQEQQGSEG